MDGNAWMNLLQNLELDKGLEALEAQSAAMSTSFMIGTGIAIAVALLWCFFGLKLIRIWSAVLGLGVGVVIGVLAAGAFRLDSTLVFVAGAVVGILLAVLGAVFYKGGIFLVAWVLGSSAGILLLQPQDWKVALGCAGAGLVAALLTIWLAEPVTMILTGLYGAFTAGTSISLLLPLESPFLRPAIIAVLAVLGITVQFLMESGKRKRRYLERARRIREENSTENEVEKARAMMEELDQLPDAEGPKRRSRLSGKAQKDQQAGRDKKGNKRQNKKQSRNPAGNKAGEEDDITFLDLDS